MKTKRRFTITYRLRRPDPAVQPSLLDPIRSVDGRDLTIEERFTCFHDANPQVYAILRQLALDLAQRGHDRIGVKMLWETLRYRYAIATTDASAYKLDNNYTSRYARLLAAEPPLAGRIELRRLTAE